MVTWKKELITSMYYIIIETIDRLRDKYGLNCADSLVLNFRYHYSKEIISVVKVYLKLQLQNKFD